MSIQIVEILGLSEQGNARPYKCRGEDGVLYYVKGRQTTRACLWHEWICAHLATRLRLPVAPFALVEVSAELLQEAPAEWRELGVGLAFGSRHHASAVWMEVGMTHKVPTEVQRDVLMFDWWIRNGDRLTGNTNLLFDASAKELVVIDHNLAFDKHFSTSDFLQHHVFAEQWSAIFSDWVLRDEYAKRLSDSMQDFEIVCNNAPTEWYWANPEMDVLANFDRNFVYQTLNRCSTPELWRTV